MAFLPFKNVGNAAPVLVKGIADGAISEGDLVMTNSTAGAMDLTAHDGTAGKPIFVALHDAANNAELSVIKANDNVLFRTDLPSQTTKLAGGTTYEIDITNQKLRTTAETYASSIRATIVDFTYDPSDTTDGTVQAVVQLHDAWADATS